MNAPPSIKSSRLIEVTPFFYGWVIVAVGTVSIIMMGPSQTFTVGIFTDYFISELSITRANISLIYGLATLGGSLLLPITGKLVDRYGPRRMVLVQVMTTPGQALLYGVLLGLSSGAYKVIDSVIWAKYYGRLHLGSIKGATMLGLVGASAFGPYPLGLSLDFLGSYTPVLNGLLILPVTIGFASLLIKRPEKRP